MARVPTSDQAGRFWLSSWGLLILGLALSALGCAVGTAELPLPTFLPVLVLFTGTALLLLGVAQQLRNETWQWPGRIESAAKVSLAGLGALAGYATMHRDWSSGHLFYGALFVLSFLGSLLILLPAFGRRLALSLVVVYHFGGMCVCATSIDPPNSTGPWVAKQLWIYAYRPYLSFLYLTNAYHFYSPDPGPPELFWFAIRYDDDSYSWYKIPERSNSPIGMYYQRHLALPAHTFQANNRLPFNNAELHFAEGKRPPRGSWEQIYYRREMGSQQEFGPRRMKIPMVLDMDAILQYREPNDSSKKLVASVARRVFWNAPPPRDEEGQLRTDLQVKSVKVYRIVHQMLKPYELAKGVSPLEKTKHWPFFLGEYDGEGNLLDLHDPFLYWYLPIAVVPDSYPLHNLETRPGVVAIRAHGEPPPGGFLLDTLELHAAGRSPRSRGERAAPIEENK